MPVYLRKNVNFTPPSIDNLPPEEEDDYVNDPELIRDELPQPYRMIDKVLTTLIDEAWDEISEREETRLEEARKVRPPQYEYALTMEAPVPGSIFTQPEVAEKQAMSYATCMSNSDDGCFIFIGLPNGLVALESLTQTYQGLWEEENTEIAYIRSYVIGPQLYLIATIDDMGIARLFAHANNRLCLLKVMNSNSPDSDNKIPVSKLEASTQGDYIGMVMENPSSKEVWLEVHKLPRDTWLTELEALIQAWKKKEEKKDQELQQSEDSESQVDQEGENMGPPPVPPADTSEPSQSRPSSAGAGSQLAAPDSVRRDPTVGEPKFSQPQLVMKVKPAQPITGNSAPSVHVACGKIDSGDVIATGQNHIFSQNHLDLRQSVFEHLHENLLKYSNKEEEESEFLQQARFHFLTAGRMIPQGMEQSSLNGRPTTVAVWWPGSTNLMHYSLVKTSKELDFKPDLVWPFTCKITASAVSDDTSVIAVGLENGNVIMWDRYQGIQRGVVSVVKDKAVIQLRFLNPSLYPQERSRYPPYPTKTGAYLMVLCADSSVYAIGTGPGTMNTPDCISNPVEKDEECLTLIEPFTAHPDLLLTVLRKGTIQLRDCLKGNVLCDIQLPHTHELTSPWEPVIALGGLGKLLYVKGTKKDDDDGGTGAQSGTVFIYQLRSFKTLDPYWDVKRSPVPFTVHTSLEERVDALLADRIAQQSNRRERMQERWTLLKDEINNIHKLKEIARINSLARPANTPGSIAKSPTGFDKLVSVFN